MTPPGEVELREALQALELAHWRYESAWALGGGPFTRELAVRGAGYFQAQFAAVAGEPPPLVDVSGHRPGAPFLDVGFGAPDGAQGLWECPLRPVLLARPVLGWPHRWLDSARLGFVYRAPKLAKVRLGKALRSAGLAPLLTGADLDAWRDGFL